MSVNVGNVLVGRSARLPPYYLTYRSHSASEHLNREPHGQGQLSTLFDHACACMSPALS